MVSTSFLPPPHSPLPCFPHLYLLPASTSSPASTSVPAPASLHVVLDRVYVALDDLELTMWTRLASRSVRDLPASASRALGLQAPFLASSLCLTQTPGPSLGIWEIQVSSQGTGEGVSCGSTYTLWLLAFVPRGSVPVPSCVSSHKHYNNHLTGLSGLFAGPIHSQFHLTPCSLSLCPHEWPGAPQIPLYLPALFWGLCRACSQSLEWPPSHSLKMGTDS